MRAIPVWFGREERPLFGWMHSPDNGSTTGGVVICAPFGREYTQAHFALRRLAEWLADSGFCVLRFDYDGMGDSAGAGDDPDRVDAWLGSVAQAIAFVRSTGVRSVSLVGMRIGATLACQIGAQDGAIDRLVLWDPCASGRSFLNEARAISALSFGIDPVRSDGGVDTPGFFCEAETVRQLRALRISDPPRPAAQRVLVLVRADRTLAPELLEGISHQPVDRIEATGQAELMDNGSPDQVLPYQAIDRIVSWFRAGEQGQPVLLRLPRRAGPRTVGTDEQGRDIVEKPVFLPSAGLFGLCCEVPEASRGPVAIFLSVANEHHVGPSRLWTDLARRWAQEGIPSLRLDLSGLGDSPTRHSGQSEFVPRAPEAFADVADAARAVSPEDPSNILLVGLCASGYQAIESALDLSPRGVITINPVLSFVPPETLDGHPVDPRRRVALPKSPLVQAFHNEGPFSGLRRRFPDLGWWLRLLVAGRSRPGAWITKLGRADVDMLFVVGEREWRPVRLGSTRWTRSAWTRSGKLRVNFAPDLEHGLLVHDQRQEISELLTGYVAERFSPAQTLDRQVVPSQ